MIEIKDPEIVVVSGGNSAERSVSLASGEAIAAALARTYPTRLLAVDEPSIPFELSPARHLVFPVLHGTGGEDGTFQRLLERAGFAYAGSDAHASKLCFNKYETKQKVSSAGVSVLPDIVSEWLDLPETHEVRYHLGEDVVIKPVCQGSSVGLFMARGPMEIAAALEKLDPNVWLFEPRVDGREFSVGLLEGRSQGIVEIQPEGGVYDFAHKYTKGKTDYICPAEVDETLERSLRWSAETAFSVCGCRDFARADFLYSERYGLVFLEINTLPGLTETSLLPKSTAAMDLPFNELARRLVRPALARFREQVALAC